MQSFQVLCAISLLASSESISVISKSKITTLKVNKNVKNPGTISMLRGGSDEHCYNPNLGSSPEPPIMCLTSNQLAQGGAIVSKSALPLVMWFGMAKLNEAAKGLNVSLNDKAGQLVVQASGLNEKAGKLVGDFNEKAGQLVVQASGLNEKAGKLVDDFNEKAGQLVVQASGLNVGLNDKAGQLVLQAVGLNEKAGQLNEKAGKLVDDFKILIRSFQIFSAVFCMLFAIFVLKPK